MPSPTDCALILDNLDGATATAHLCGNRFCTPCSFFQSTPQVSTKRREAPIQSASRVKPADGKPGGTGQCIAVRRTLFVVDLGALQLVGIIDVERFPLRVEIKSGKARFAVAVAGVLRATKG